MRKGFSNLNIWFLGFWCMLWLMSIIFSIKGTVVFSLLFVNPVISWFKMPIRLQQIWFFPQTSSFLLNLSSNSSYFSLTAHATLAKTMHLYRNLAILLFPTKTQSIERKLPLYIRKVLNNPTFWNTLPLKNPETPSTFKGYSHIFCISNLYHIPQIWYPNRWWRSYLLGDSI